MMKPETPKNQRIQRRVFSLMRRLNLTRYELAEIMAISPATLRSRLRGESTFSQTELAAFAKYADTKPEWFHAVSS